MKAKITMSQQFWFALMLQLGDLIFLMFRMFSIIKVHSMLRFMFTEVEELLELGGRENL